MLATEMQMNAVLAGAEPNKAEEFVKTLRQAAERLRRPEGMEEPEPLDQVEMSEAMRRFLRPSEVYEVESDDA